MLNNALMAQRIHQMQEQRMQQRLAPLQVQYVRMLEMTTPEVEDAVRKALEENPALEIAETGTTLESNEDYYNASADDSMSQKYINNQSEYSVGAGARDWIANIATDNYDETLVSHLDRQLNEIATDERQLHIARYLLGEIDGNGRIARSAHDIADDLAFNAGVMVENSEVARAIELIKSLDPAGIGAIDLQECLLIQLKRYQQPYAQVVSDAILLLEKYYDLYARRRFDLLTSSTGMSSERLRAADELVRNLNPKPGSQFAGGDRLEKISSAIIPDFNVETEEDGTITISLASSIPDLTISESFKVDAGADEFVRQHREEAVNTIRLLQMRARTMLRIMKAIAYLQRDFFKSEDKNDIRPMVLRDVAEITGDDLSVISRATAGKYVNTPGGVYPLKMFFSEHSQADPTGNGSVHKVLSTLKEIIEQEDPHHPLTDEAICVRMKEAGYDIARRTVAKYREDKLGIPVARLRRKA